jgi:phenylpropionate dioxygenase-like ring-hydroxylating dioxygenase large terminal subunit
MLSAEAVRSVRKPLAEAATLPPEFYHSEEFYRLEQEHIFRRKWLLLGREDQWKEAGSYKTYTLFGVPFIVIKGKDGQLRALSNSCSHRGSSLLSGEGRCSAIICPYHSWMYGLDGRLLGAPGMKTDGSFDASCYGLEAVRLEVWNTFVFVNLSKDAPTLAHQLGDLGKYLESYDFSNVVTVGQDEYAVGTNWKCFLENSMEWLHHPTVHRQSIAGKVAKVRRNPIAGNPGDYVLIQSLAGGASRATLENERGFPPTSTLTGAAREGSHYVMLYPYSMIGCDVDSVWMKQMIPEGPGRVRNIATYCFHKEAIDHPDYDQIAPNYFRRFRKVVSEDNAAMERQFAGLKSPLARPGRYAEAEILVHKFNNWVLDQVEGENGGSRG